MESSTQYDPFRSKLAAILDDYTGQTIMHSVLIRMNKDIVKLVIDSIEMGYLPFLGNYPFKDASSYMFGLGYKDGTDFTEMTPDKMELIFYSADVGRYMLNRLKGLINVTWTVNF